jgi:hypothetical protein
MVGIDDVVAELELDELDFARDLELVLRRVLLRCLCRNDLLLLFRSPKRTTPSSSL